MSASGKIFSSSFFVCLNAAPTLHPPRLSFYADRPLAPVTHISAGHQVTFLSPIPFPSPLVSLSHSPPFFVPLPTEKEDKLHRSCILLLFQRDTSALA